MYYFVLLLLMASIGELFGSDHLSAGGSSSENGSPQFLHQATRCSNETEYFPPRDWLEESEGFEYSRQSTAQKESRGLLESDLTLKPSDLFQEVGIHIERKTLTLAAVNAYLEQKTRISEVRLLCKKYETIIRNNANIFLRKVGLIGTGTIEKATFEEFENVVAGLNLMSKVAQRLQEENSIRFDSTYNYYHSLLVYEGGSGSIHKLMLWMDPQGYNNGVKRAFLSENCDREHGSRLKKVYNSEHMYWSDSSEEDGAISEVEKLSGNARSSERERMEKWLDDRFEDATTYQRQLKEEGIIQRLIWLIEKEFFAAPEIVSIINDAAHPHSQLLSDALCVREKSLTHCMVYYLQFFIGNPTKSELSKACAALELLGRLAQGPGARDSRNLYSDIKREFFAIDDCALWILEEIEALENKGEAITADEKKAAQKWVALLDACDFKRKEELLEKRKVLKEKFPSQTNKPERVDKKARVKTTFSDTSTQRSSKQDGFFERSLNSLFSIKGIGMTAAAVVASYFGWKKYSAAKKSTDVAKKNTAMV